MTLNSSLGPEKSVTEKSSSNTITFDPLTIKKEALIIKFRNFCGYRDDKGVKHEGMAFPPPIDDKGRYLGILEHEILAFWIIWTCIKKGVMFKWPRGFGKTYVGTWFMQFTMYYLGWPWMYLSVTDVLGDVADWVYRWATRNKLITGTVKGGRKNTYRGFKLSTGGRLLIFDYLGEEMVGKHGYYLMLDDIVKKKWSDKPSENRKAKRQWNYSVNYIRRKGLVILGTSKFEGDPLEYLQGVIPDLHIEVKTPFIMDGVFPDWIPVIDPETGNEMLWVPELFTYEELQTKKMQPTEDGTDPLTAWMAEMMQDPRPLAGGSWQKEDLIYLTNFDPGDYEAAAIAVDPAFTISLSSDETGITVNLLHRELDKYGNRQFLCIRALGLKIKVQDWNERWHPKVKMFYSTVFYDSDNTKMVNHKGMLTIITELFEYLHTQLPSLDTIIIPIETNSGGDIIIQQIEYETDKYAWAGHIVEVRHTNIDKRDRIDKELFSPIKMGNQKYLSILEGGSLEYQILTFPNSVLIDILDSHGMGKDELNKLKRISSARERRESLLAELERRDEQQMKDDWDNNMGIKGIRDRGRSGGGKRGGRSML